VHRLIHEDQPYSFLYASESLSLLHRRFEGVTEGKLGLGHDFVRWYVPETRRKYRSLVLDA
jgi:peptide/nickel transport system substrate-binding protein